MVVLNSQNLQEITKYFVPASQHLQKNKYYVLRIEDYLNNLLLYVDGTRFFERDLQPFSFQRWRPCQLASLQSHSEQKTQGVPQVRGGWVQQVPRADRDLGYPARLKKLFSYPSEWATAASYIVL